MPALPALTPLPAAAVAAVAAAAALVSSLPLLRAVRFSFCEIKGQLWADLLRALTSKADLVSLDILHGYLESAALQGFSLGSVRELSIQKPQLTGEGFQDQFLDLIVGQLPQSNVLSLLLRLDPVDDDPDEGGFYTSAGIVRLFNSPDKCPRLKTLAFSVPQDDNGAALCALFASLPFSSLEEIRLEALAADTAVVFATTLGRCKSLRRVRFADAKADAARGGRRRRRSGRATVCSA